MRAVKKKGLKHMNREIKFRAWDINVKRWVPQYKNMVAPIGMISEWSKERGFHINEYTGLKDKNGVEIYEGDIVKRNEQAKGYKEKWLDEACELFWNSDKAQFALKNHETWGLIWDMEIIGNIYENPELLENK